MMEHVAKHRCLPLLPPPLSFICLLFSQGYTRLKFTDLKQRVSMALYSERSKLDIAKKLITTAETGKHTVQSYKLNKS